MGGQIRCRVLSVQFQLLLQVWMCKTRFGGSLVNAVSCGSLLVGSSRIKVFRGTEVPGDGEGVVMLLRRSKKLSLTGLKAVYPSKGVGGYH